MTTEQRKMEKGIDEIVGVFTDPIIVMPGGWGDTLPGWLKESITLERLIMNVEALKTGKMTATDAEACAYLYTASLEAPIDHDWAEIYFYVATKTYEKFRTKDSGVTMPADIRVEKLNRNQEDDLARLKGWLYDTRIKVRQERGRGERRAAKEAKQAGEEASKLEQLAFQF